jgi:very-short-patch-repair endonuclease
MKKSICIRLLLIVLFLFCGNVFPVFFFVAAVIAYSIFFDLRGEPHKGTDSPVQNAWALQHQKDLTFITPKTVGWKEIFEGVCESPAEVGFLNAMISSYQLIPDLGILKGGSLELQLQIPICRYRVDFLANKHLVVEIDGATYHSSPEAVEKDRIRDEYLIENGYVVLRIPAKVVFNSPSDAVERVRCAISNLAHELSIRAQKAAHSAMVPKPDPPLTFFGSLGKSLQAGSDYMNSALLLKPAKEALDEALDEAYSLEKHCIEAAIDLGREKMEVEAWSRSSPRANELYLESLKQLRAIPGRTQSSRAPVVVPPFRLPEIDSGAEYKTLAGGIYSALLKERLQYFDDIRKTLEKDSELAKYVKQALERLVKNSDDLWHLIQPANTCNSVNLHGKSAKYGTSWTDSVLAKQPITDKIVNQIFNQSHVESRAGESSHLPLEHLDTGEKC